MTFVGNSPIKFKNIILLSPINSNNLSNELRKNDIFIFASKTESCSNSLLEALHCGLPSIGFNSTSMPQIINKGGELFNRKEEIPNILTKIVNNYEYYVNNIILPNIDDIGKEYFSFCKKIKEDNKYKEFGKISFIGNLLYIKFIFIFKLLYMKFKRIFLK
jgi:glycosyltransferase involved in cell wall biosynthesis